MASAGVGLPDFPGSPHRHQGGGGQQDTNMYRFSPEELRIGAECGRDALFYRSIPVSAASMIGAYFAVLKGYFPTSAKYGSRLTVLAAGFFGYIIGKMSYMPECQRRLNQLPDSQVGPLTRHLRQKRPSPMHTSATDLDYAEGGTSTASNITGLGGSGTWEINAVDNVDVQGMDDLQRPSMDNPMTMSEDDKSSQSDLMYETLRKRNREEYEARHANVLYDVNRTEQQKAPLQSPPTSNHLPTTSSGVRNEYGDLVD